MGAMGALLGTGGCFTGWGGLGLGSVEETGKWGKGQRPGPGCLDGEAKVAALPVAASLGTVGNRGKEEGQETGPDQESLHSAFWVQERTPPFVQLNSLGGAVPLS